VSLPAYPAYRDSGVPWLGQVPAGWAVVPVKAIASCNDDVLPENMPPDEVIEYVEISDVEEGRGIIHRTPMTFAEAPSRARRKVQAGDVIVSTVRTYLRAIATIPPDCDRLVVSTGFAVFRPRRVLASFLGYLFRTEFVVAQIIARSVGVSYPAINASEVARLPIPLPPPAEQRAIAAFLDRECGKMDALVAEQERLIALLKEKQQAVISHAVTKGLDPNAPMKDSGVAWLGQVPAHWEVKRLKDIGTLVGGAGFPHEEQGREGEELPFYKVADLARAEGGRTMGDAESTISRETASALRARIIPGNSIVYAKIGAALLLNRRRITTRPCCIDNNMTAFTPALERLSTLWAWYWLSIIDFGQVANPGAVPSFSEGDQEILPIALPDLNEQRAITAFLDRECSKLDSVTTEAERAIALLKERRAALISAAVTGKIDVRGLAAPAETEATAA
jgi:type I restriction enzyme S subunit